MSGISRFCFVFLLLGLALNAVSQTTSSSAVTEGYTTTASGVRIHYLQSGPESSKNAIILIPGWRLPAYLWDEQLKRLGREHRVIAIDPRSQGASSKTADGNTPETRAKDLSEIMTNLKITQAVLVGWSQGAQDVAAYVAQFGTDSLAGVVFVDSPVSIGAAEVELHPQFSKAIISMMPIYANYPKEYSDRMVRGLFKKPLADPEVQKIVQFTLQTPTDTGLSMLVTDIFGADRRAALTKLNKPALVVASAESNLLDAQKEMAKVIPGAKFVPIDGAAHAVFVDQPEKFDGVLEDFLLSLPR
jgi:non-heme chloroperoxidase